MLEELAMIANLALKLESLVRSFFLKKSKKGNVALRKVQSTKRMVLLQQRRPGARAVHRWCLPGFKGFQKTFFLKKLSMVFFVRIFFSPHSIGLT